MFYAIYQASMLFDKLHKTYFSSKFYNSNVSKSIDDL